MKRGLWMIALLFVVPGCVNPAPPLPTVSWASLEEARTFLTDQQTGIDSVQTQLKIRFTSPDGENNNFDGALVLEGEDRFRLRTWKLNQTIFDLTVNREGTFVVAIDEMKERSPDSAAELGALANNLGAMLRGPSFAEAQIQTTPPESGRIAPIPGDWVWLIWLDGNTVAAVDRRTLAPTFWWAYGEDDGQRITLETRYADYAGGRWFRWLVVEGDFGRFEMTFRDVELNGELNPRAFRPPRRAVWVENLADSPDAENASP